MTYGDLVLSSCGDPTVRVLRIWTWSVGKPEKGCRDFRGPEHAVANAPRRQGQHDSRE
ncbi:hypothetical protein [Leptolyngbya sp. 7M]|uniref:hypothetical protein n=1 Tax=Leptolyngbya sp. 7M TaxID=2812896 RepID=UPI001B8AFFDE|nr:hypothetical protein [Leptolyngbya sp. 7M]QYO64596.1 hypothetical protein JVX88_34020 [Leptolyngbya sp. 7M]